MRSCFIRILRVLLLAVLLISQGSSVRSVKAETSFTVNSNSDNGDAVPGDFQCKDQFGLCTLRAAIEETNASGAATTINFTDMPVDTITINAPLHINRGITINGRGKEVTKIQQNGIPNEDIGFIVESDLTLNFLTLRNFTQAVQINANGINLQVNNSQIIDSGNAINSLQYAQIRLYHATIQNIIGNTAIINNNGQLDLVNSSVIQNQSHECGGITNLGRNATLIVESTRIEENEATVGNGGGICNYGGVVQLTDTSLSNNISSEMGGGIYQQGGELFIFGSSEVRSNMAEIGGGVYSQDGSVVVERLGIDLPQIDSNTAVKYGGGLYLSGDGEFRFIGAVIKNNTVDNSGGIAVARGGGVYFHQGNLYRSLLIYHSAFLNNQATAGSGGGLSVGGPKAFVFINNTTFSGNTSTANGAGVELSQGHIEFSNVTVSNNTCNSDNTGGGQGGGLYVDDQALVTIRNTIIGDNQDIKDSTLDFFAPDVHGAIISEGYNLIANKNDWTKISGDTVGNILNMSTGLLPIDFDALSPHPQSPHHPLMDTSPAVNGGNPAGCRDQFDSILLTDQIGRDRALQGRCDMGAVESAHNPLTILIDLELQPVVVMDGDTSTGTVKLNQVAPPGGVEIHLASDKPSASLPDTVIVPAGQNSQTFSITTSSVAVDTLAQISASLNSITRMANLVIRPQTSLPALVSIALNPTELPGGLPISCTVTLDRIAPPGGTVVALSSNLSEVLVPASITIPVGASSATVDLQSLSVESYQLATITAELASIARDASVTLIPEMPILIEFRIKPSSVECGDSFEVIASIDRPAPVGGSSIVLTVNDSSVHIPPLLVITEGAFTVRTDGHTAPVVNSRQAFITAELAPVTRQVEITLLADKCSFVFLPLTLH